jgi:uncharacterized membrane protein
VKRLKFGIALSSVAGVLYAQELVESIQAGLALDAAVCSVIAAAFAIMTLIGIFKRMPAEKALNQPTTTSEQAEGGEG